MASWPPLCFTAVVSIFFRRLISEVAWPTATPRNLAAQKHQISERFHTTSRLDREYLQNATRHRRSENGVARYEHSRTGRLNSVYFGPQMAKTGPEF